MKNSWLGIQGKLFILVGLSLIAFAGTVFYSSYNLNTVTTQNQFMSSERYPFAEDVSDLETLAQALPRYLFVAAANGKGTKGREEALKLFEEHSKEYDEVLEKFKKYKSLSGKTKELIDSLNPLMEKTDVVTKKITDHLQAEGKDEEVIARKLLTEELTQFTDDLDKTAVEIGKLTLEENNKYTSDTAAQSVFAQKSLWVVSGVIGFFLSVFGFFFARSLVRNLSRITDAVSGASEQVSSASLQISQGAEKLSTATQSQASSLEETSASLTEISGMSDSNTKESELAEQSAKEVHAITEETRQSMEQLTTAMSQILESNDRIVKLVKIIEEIGEKTQIIDDIVFKTQLLSFNASVEAERAGEHGRGFSVVAQEVGNLAQMSGQAATEISSIVKNSIKEAEAVARENRERVESGGELAGSTKDKMEVVLTKLSDVMEAVSKITAASREQSQGVGQITNAIETLNQMTQDTASTAEESASASTELTGQAQSLMGLVRELRLIVEGSNQRHSVLRVSNDEDGRKQIVQHAQVLSMKQTDSHESEESRVKRVGI